MTDVLTEEQLNGLIARFPKRVSSATLILENEHGEAIIEKANYKPYWSFPGGLIEPGETPKQAAVRETREELGIVIDPELLEFVAVINRSSKTAETYQFVFRAVVSSGVLDHIIIQEAEIEAWSVVTKGMVSTDNREYAKMVQYWSENRTGYIEQIFGQAD